MIASMAVEEALHLQACPQKPGTPALQPDLKTHTIGPPKTRADPGKILESGPAPDTAVC